MAAFLPKSTWFEMLFGFREGAYSLTKANFELLATDGASALRSKANGKEFTVGSFSHRTLAHLRERASAVGKRGTAKLTHVAVGDALELHALNPGATFQVASQFNCLEFGSSAVVPERGVTIYASDPTQGPACSLAAAAATVFRNYFVAMPNGASGQTRDNQLNGLDLVIAELPPSEGATPSLVEVRNGYTFSQRLPELRRVFEKLALAERERMLGLLKVGLHLECGVTFSGRYVQCPLDEDGKEITVSQCFCSAVSCAYSGHGAKAWAPFARFVLDGMYEATPVFLSASL